MPSPKGGKSVSTTAPLFKRKPDICAFCGAGIFELRVYKDGNKRYHESHHPKLRPAVVQNPLQIRGV